MDLIIQPSMQYSPLFSRRFHSIYFYIFIWNIYASPDDWEKLWRYRIFSLLLTVDEIKSHKPNPYSNSMLIAHCLFHIAYYDTYEMDLKINRMKNLPILLVEWSDKRLVGSFDLDAKLNYCFWCALFCIANYFTHFAISPTLAAPQSFC